MLYIDYICIEAPPWQEFGYIDSLIYTLAAHHTLFTVCTSFSVKFLIQGLILIFFLPIYTLCCSRNVALFVNARDTV